MNLKYLLRLLSCVFLLLFLSVPMMLVGFAVFITSRGPIIYWSDRIGKDNVVFKMPKFRSMSIDTPILASHLLGNSDEYLSPIGSFLRRYSLDELPQIYSVLKGDMAFIGPRPALFNQEDLIALRVDKGIDKLLPGITGWAQVNGRDNLSIPDKVALELDYLNRQSFRLDMQILWMTFIKVFRREGVSH